MRHKRGCGVLELVCAVVWLSGHRAIGTLCVHAESTRCTLSRQHKIANKPSLQISMIGKVSIDHGAARKSPGCLLLRLAYSISVDDGASQRMILVLSLRPTRRPVNFDFRQDTASFQQAKKSSHPRKCSCLCWNRRMYMCEARRVVRRPGLLVLHLLDPTESMQPFLSIDTRPSLSRMLVTIVFDRRLRDAAGLTRACSCKASSK